MRKARNKKFSLIMALVFAFTMVFPMGLAFGAESITFSNAVGAVDKDTAAQPLGWAKVTIPLDDSTIGYVYATVELPDGVTFEGWDSAAETLGAAANFVSGPAPVFKSQKENSYTIATKASAGTDPDESYVQFKFTTADSTVYVDSDEFDGDYVNVKFSISVTDSDGFVLYSNVTETLTLAKIKSDDITVSAGNPTSVKVGTGKETAKIKISENMSGALDAGTTPDEIYFELPSGFKWSDSLDGSTVSGKYGLAGSLTLNSDRDELTLTITSQSSTFADELEFTGVIDVYPGTSDGDVTVDVTANTTDVNETELVIAVVGDSDVTVTADDDTGMEDYMYVATTDDLWNLKFETDGTFASGDDIIIRLPSGVVFTDAMETASISTDVDNRGLFDDNTGLWLEVNGNGAGNSEITLSGMTVAALPGVEIGDLVIEISGVVDTTVVAGKVINKVEVNAETTKVIAGIAQVAGDITLTETKKGALSSADDIYLSLPSGVIFNNTPTVEVNGKEAKNAASKIDDGKALKIDLPTSLSSGKIDTIVISGIKYDIDSRMYDGDISVKIGGYNAADDDLNELDGTAGTQFEDEADDAVITVVNATLKQQNTIETSFTVGDEGVAIMNGRTLVQVNMLCDVLGLQKSWDSASKTAYFVKDGNVVAFPMGENAIYINGVKVPQDQGGVIINGYTYATLRGIQAAFGGELAWDGATKTATFNFEK